VFLNKLELANNYLKLPHCYADNGFTVSFKLNDITEVFEYVAKQVVLVIYCVLIRAKNSSRMGPSIYLEIPIPL